MEDEQINNSGDIGGNSGTSITEPSEASAAVQPSTETVPVRSTDMPTDILMGSPMDRDEIMTNENDNQNENNSRLS